MTNTVSGRNQPHRELTHLTHRCAYTNAHVHSHRGLVYTQHAHMGGCAHMWAHTGSHTRTYRCAHSRTHTRLHTPHMVVCGIHTGAHSPAHTHTCSSGQLPEAASPGTGAFAGQGLVLSFCCAHRGLSSWGNRPRPPSQAAGAGASLTGLWGPSAHLAPSVRVSAPPTAPTTGRRGCPAWLGLLGPSAGVCPQPSRPYPPPLQPCRPSWSPASGLGSSGVSG